jgi:hypothetical protein
MLAVIFWQEALGREVVPHHRTHRHKREDMISVSES